AAHEYGRQAEAMYQRVLQKGAWFVLNQLQPLGTEGNRLADAGLDAEARSRITVAEGTVASLKDAESTSPRSRTFTQCTLHFTRAQISMGFGEFKAVQAEAREATRLVQGVEPDAPHEGLMKYTCDFYAPLAQGEAELWLGENQAALLTLQ